MGKNRSLLLGCLVVQFVCLSAVGAETWSTVDYLGSPSKRLWTSAVTVAPSGKLYVAGYEEDVSTATRTHFIRMSSDQGASWRTTGQLPPPRYFHDGRTLAVNLAGDLFAVLEAGGTQLDGPNAHRWVVAKSSDEGANWKVVDDWQHTPELFSQPQSITISPKGDIFVVGAGRTVVDADPAWIVRRSSDQGATWETVEVWNGEFGGFSLAKEIVSTSAGVYVVGSSHKPETDPAPHYIRRSLDSGVTWETVSEFPEIIQSLKADSQGWLWALFRRYFPRGEEPNATVLRRSKDGGLSWETFPDVLSNVGLSTGMVDLAIGVRNEVFVGGAVTNGRSWVVLVSRDGGQSFETSEAFVAPGNVLGFLGADDSGNVYAAGRGLLAGTSEFRQTLVVRRTQAQEEVPSLQITLLGQSVRLAWQTNSIPFLLETKATLDPAGTWSNVPAAVIPDGPRSIVTLQRTSTGSAFYRLRKQL